MKSFIILAASAVSLTLLAPTDPDTGRGDATEVSGLPTGTITGRVVLEPPPPPRRVARGRGYQQTSEFIQQLPAVVYVRGAFGGGSTPTDVVMTQRDTAFVPGVVALTVGGTVSFPNEDPFFHNVFSYSEAKRLDLGRYPQGDSKSEVFGEVGIVEVFCEVHEEMRGAIIVTENPYHAVVDEDGNFSITGVPAGEHTVVFWSADHSPLERTVSVPDGGSARIEVELSR